jgi:hypothetical protein
MNQIDGSPYRYSVGQQETITIRITPVGVKKFITANLDGHTVAKPPGANPTYVFTVTKPKGKVHVFFFAFDFPGVPANANARYDIELSGSNPGGPFNVSVNQSDPDKDVFFRFFT